MGETLFDKVERQTRLAGHNRVAMLLFTLGDAQLFGINVFKVREVLRRPPLERMRGVHALLAGSCDYRGQTIPVIDLAAALGYPPLQDDATAHLMVTEFNRSVQGFLVADVQRMVHCDGDTLAAPSRTLGFGPRVNAVTRIDGVLLAVVDVEHVLAGIADAPTELSTQMQQAVATRPAAVQCVLVVDDSQVARRQVVSLLQQMHLQCMVACDGREAMERLQAWVDNGDGPRVDLVISDIEMPRLDGYALTRAIRENPGLRGLKVLLHSSLSGIFNEAMVREVKADRFVAKFQPDLLAQAVLDLLPARAEDAIAQIAEPAAS